MKIYIILVLYLIKIHQNKKGKQNMNREETTKRIISLIMKAFDENNYSFIREAFTVACDFNSENLGSDVAEIFMSEDDDYVMVDDDMFYFPENAF